tara:strand:- start:42 stop:602 length:561 start_codon:yes stop_codon:yes gene_type:complete
MANNNVLKISPDKLGEIVNKLVNNKLMMIGKAHPPGQPGPPNPDPSSPYEKGKSPHKLLANANNIRGTGKPPLANDDSYGRGNVPGHPDWKLAGGPSFDIGPGHGAAKKKAKGFNKTRNNPNDREVEMIKKWLGGPKLPDVSGATSEQIRGRLKPFTHGTGYDKEGGSLRGVPDVLRKQLLIDAKA